MAVQTVRQAPAEFIEAAGKTYLDELTKAVGGVKDIDLSTIMGPQFVAQPGALQTEAERIAVAEDTGLGSFRPFLEGAAAATGPDAYKAYMSPYQRDVIDATLRQFDVQAERGLPALSARAISAGAFGGGREGVERAVYESQSDINRAALEAQLLQQGFTQAQQLAGRQYQQQLGLAQAAPSLVGQQVGALSSLGAQQQAQEQARLQASQQLAQRQAYQPLEAAQTLGSGIMGLISGYPGGTTTQVTPSPSPLATALGVGSTLAGIYRAFKGPFG